MERGTAVVILVEARPPPPPRALCLRGRKSLTTRTTWDGARRDGVQWTLLYAAAAYEALRHALTALLERRRLNATMVAATLFTVYPNFYSFFCTYNYLNDQFYQLLPTQTFFSVTEMIMAVCCYVQVDGDLAPPSRVRRQLLWTACTVASVHLIQSQLDQGIAYVGRIGVALHARAVAFLPRGLTRPHALFSPPVLGGDVDAPLATSFSGARAIKLCGTSALRSETSACLSYAVWTWSGCTARTIRAAPS